MKNIRRSIAWILVVVFLCNQITTQVYAQEGQYNQTVSGGDSVLENTKISTVSDGDGIQAGFGDGITMKGETSFGTLLANELSEEATEQQENNGYNIFSVEMQGESAIVSFESVEDSVVVIGIYDETGAEMLTSASIEVYAGETTAIVDFEADSIPEYFYIKGYIVEARTYRPLCTVYESPMYTQEMQEFLAKTTADFDAERVLNLDEDEANNFAVFSEETILISGNSGQNRVVEVDETNNVYVIEDADSSVTSLQAGDIFSYAYQENDVLIVKVASIEVDGTTVTITGADTSMEEVFDYIKIDEEMGSEEAIVDASSCGDGVTYEGLVDFIDEDTPQTYGLEIDETTEKAYKMEIDTEFGSVDGVNVKISGELDMNLKFAAKVYLTLEMQYVELKLDYAAKISAAITGHVSAEVPLMSVSFMYAGIVLELTPSVVAEADVALSIEGTLSGTVGFRAQVGAGITNLTTTPKFESAIKVEGTLFVGLAICPKIKILSDKIAAVSLEAKVGAEIKAAIEIPLEQTVEDKMHTCKVCVAGEVNGKFSISVVLEFLNSFKYTITPVELRFKLFDFYYSLDEDDFGLTTCPYYVYRGEVIVMSEEWKTMPDITVRIDNDYLTTNENGKVEFWATVGAHSVWITEEGYAYSSKDLTLKEGGESLVVVLEKEKVGDEDSGNCEDGENDSNEEVLNKIVKQVSLGGYHSAVITEDGDLYTWGYNKYGQLGDGTNSDRTTPKRIMSEVKEVSLGWEHSAAITEDGNLYMWGNNFHGQLGDGTSCDSNTPKWIMSNVKDISLGHYHSAAMTEDGDLYTWGYNEYGQLGTETGYNYSATPEWIMSNVEKVSFGGLHSAAITEDGILYTWGDNSCFCLGDGTVKYRTTPKWIMSYINFKETSLGDGHSAAITKDGDLYMWGDNYYDQLGVGTGINKTQPKLVMSNIKEVSLGGYHSAAITEDGNLYTWGNNSDGQLGAGTEIRVTQPKQVMSNIKEVSLGGHHSAAITENGDLYTWGYNANGQLGDGTETNSNIPIKLEIYTETETVLERGFFSTRSISGATMVTETKDIWNGTNFINLIPNETYNYYVMKDKELNQPFSTDNLFYIGQAVTDDAGTLNVAFISEVATEGVDIFAVPMHRSDLSEAEVSVEDLTYNGEEQYVRLAVRYQDTLLMEGVDYNVRGDYGVTSPGEYTLTIAGIGLYTGTISAEYRVLSDEVGYIMEGTMTSFGDEATGVTLQLRDSTETLIIETTVIGNNIEYALENILAGTYTLQVSKTNHVTREYDITVSEGAVTQDVEIHLIGDVNGDGKINAKDKKIIYNHIAGESLLTEYDFFVGDVNSDGKINAKDKKVIYNHIAGENLLW